MRALIQYQQQWLEFSQPSEVLSASTTEQVQTCLDRIAHSDLWAVGYLCYEAASALNPDLSTHAPGGLPLLCFGLFPPPDRTTGLPTGDYAVGHWTPSLSQQDYTGAIQRIKTYLAAGDTYQVNYTFRLRAPFSGDPAGLFSDMIAAQQGQQSQQGQYGAYLEFENLAICSASPELFFELRDGRMTTRPMKGTAARGLTLAEDLAMAAKLRASDKDRAENRMILDMMRNDIGRLAEIGSVITSSPFEVEKYPTLWQMTSTVSGTTRYNLAQVLRSLFPCASITGAPKVRTMEIIRELESAPRGLYTGTIGVIEPGGGAQFNVAIRTAVVNRRQQQVDYGIGGGIIWDSEAASEYREALAKAAILTRRHPPFRLLETLRWDADGLFLLEGHLRRLRDSATYFDFPCDIDRIRAALLALNPGENSRIRLLLDHRGDFEIQTLPLAAPGSDPSSAPRDPLRLALATEAVDAENVFLYHKTTNRALYDQAKAACPHADDVLLFNQHGEVTETCTANIVLDLQGQRLTPPVSCGLLAGTLREQLLNEGKIREAVLSIIDAQRADGLWLINSVQHWRRARLE